MDPGDIAIVVMLGLGYVAWRISRRSRRATVLVVTTVVLLAGAGAGALWLAGSKGRECDRLQDEWRLANEVLTDPGLSYGYSGPTERERAIDEANELEAGRA